MTAKESEQIARLTVLVEGMNERLGNDDEGLIKRVATLEAKWNRLDGALRLAAYCVSFFGFSGAVYVLVLLATGSASASP